MQPRRSASPWSDRSHDGTAAQFPRFIAGGAGSAFWRRSRFFYCVLAGIVVLLCLSASSASAALTRPYTGVSFGPDGVGGNGSFGNVQGIAVDQADGDVLVYDALAGKVYKFDAAGQPVPFSALGGANVIEGVGGLDEHGMFEPNTQQIAIAPPGSPGGTAGDIYVSNNSHSILIFDATGVRLGELAIGAETCGVATNGAGHLFVGAFGPPSVVHEFVPSANPPVSGDETAASVASLPGTCNVAVDNAGGVYATNYLGQEIAKVEPIDAPSTTLITPGAPSIAVDPGTGNLLADRGDLVAEYESDGTLVETFGNGQLTGSAGVAVNAATEEAYVGDNGSGKVKIFGAVATVPKVTTGAATAVTTQSAELHGTVNPEGVPLEGCKFEYGPTTEAGFGNEIPCVPPASSLPVDSPSPVSASVAGLQSNTTYRFRLAVANSAANATGQPETFTTSGPPVLTELGAAEATQTSAILEATVNPRGFPTSYRFEWGPTTAYGNTVGAGSIDASNPPTGVHVDISGLAVGTTYHWRLVASNGEGPEATSPDQEVETLDSCGLSAHRCFELVSPKEPGPVATGGNVGGRQLTFQGAGSGPGALAYTMENGLPEANRGAEVLYRGDRSAFGWSSEQLSPGLRVQNTKPEDSGSDQFLGMSTDLSCSIVASSQPLTPDPAVRQLYEAGREILYRRNGDGTYTAITNLVPANLETTGFLTSGTYELVGMSQDCDTVVFETRFEYSGIPVIPRSNLGGNEPRFLYEWRDGSIRSIGEIPGPSGDTLIEAPFAATSENHSNVVSANGSRIFFAADRLVAANPADPAEIGTPGVFVREVTNGQPATRDISGSETTTPDIGATYQYATPDGAHVFFTANAGLTQRSGSGQADLYEYDMEANPPRLIDRSVGPTREAAEVAGVLGASADGARVYFASPAQLVPGRGSTATENASAGTYSLYEEQGGGVHYVGRLERGEVRPFVSHQRELTSRVSADGRYLLFETAADVTGYKSGSPLAKEAYLYDSETEETVCVSCRRDARPSTAGTEFEFAPLAKGSSTSAVYASRSLTVDRGKPRVFFTSIDGLAPGGAEGLPTIYEWAHGQVAAVAAETPGHFRQAARFADASDDGADLYLTSSQALTWEDTDGRTSVYDARSGGGFPEPGRVSQCDASQEGSCNGSPAPAPASAQISSSGVAGPGNPVTRKKKKPNRHKHRKRSKHKHKHKHKKGARQKHRKRAAHRKNKRTSTRSRQGTERGGQR